MKKKIKNNLTIGSSHKIDEKMKILTITQSILLASIALLSINSYYITFTNILGFLNITLLIAISITIFTFPESNLEFHQKTLIFLNTFSLFIFNFKIYEISLGIIFTTILILFLVLYFCFKNTNNHIEEIEIYSPNKENILKKKYIDEGGLGDSQYVI
ncbi:hypothetical protein AB3N60_11425 [Leptospira sp. WS39.C2]